MVFIGRGTKWVIQNKYFTDGLIHSKEELVDLKNFCKIQGRKLYLANNFRLAVNLNLDGVYLSSFNKGLGYKKYNIKLDSIYNAKMIFRIMDLINNKNWIFGKKILIINTGGTQSVEGINKLLKKKGCETINY